jgi:hypothetical protein
MSWRPCDRSIVGAENSQAGHLARRQSRRLVEQALAVAAPTSAIVPAAKSTSAQRRFSTSPSRQPVPMLFSVCSGFIPSSRVKDRW